MLIPIILSGGAGTRLWPVSRKAHPKPFMRLGDGESLAEKTLRRALGVATEDHVITVTSRDYYFYTRDIYQAVEPDGDKTSFILEPFGRNTAPAIAVAAMQVRDQFGPEANMMVMPADHLISKQAVFADAVEEAARLASQGYLVTFGVYPTQPETGYGYIRSGRELNADEAFEVEAFVEKPDLETAKKYVDSGDYQWNSGMFCFGAQTILDRMSEFSPDVLEAAEAVWSAMDEDSQPKEIPAEVFEKCPDISIDYAVMEKSDRRAVVAGHFGWSDIGSWKAISELYESDETGNRIKGRAVMVDSRNCFVQGDERLVAGVGLDDIVIVDTGDAVLVADRDRAQEVKQVVEHLREKDDEIAEYHQTVHRPWGSYTILEDEDDCKVKRLVVKPGQVLSLQLHHKRAEHWTVVQGTAKVRLGDDEFLLNANESTYIPVETLHRLENPGDDDVHLIEVQTGSYFGEDDIERFEDIYGRA